MTLRPWQDGPYPPHRWQAEALTAGLAALARGERPIIRACTGAGKSYLTAEFARLAEARGRTVVVLVPTQDLVRQTAGTLRGRCVDVGEWYDACKDRARVTVCCYASLSTLLDDLAARDVRVDLMIADECHGTEADTRLRDLRAADARWMLGLTATPYRADEAESLSLWSGLCYEYGVGDAVSDGVLVPVQVIESDAPAGTLVDEALDAMYRDLPRRPGGGIRPGVVSSISVADCEAYAEAASSMGWRCATVHYRVPKAEIARRIKALRVGDLDFLVHVSMLSEGVDLPWLWWIALRRPLGSRVALVQTVGRVVRVDRSDAAKGTGLVLDPHGICDTLRLTHEAAVGEPAVIDETPEPRARDGEPEGPAVPMVLDGRRIRGRVSDAERMWRQLRVGLELTGAMPAGMSRGRWVSRPASAEQRAALERMRWATRHLPGPYKDAWKQLSRHEGLTRGCASDLLDIAVAAADGGRHARETRRSWTLDLPAEGPTDE